MITSRLSTINCIQFFKLQGMKNKSRAWVYPILAVLIILTGCKKDPEFYFNLSPWVKYGSLTDKDGNKYKTILIGTQTWMAENLTTMKYNDGTSIPVVTDGTLWNNLSSAACCWQNNDPARKVTYGVLYNWYTVNSGKLCPVGWHVPNDEEWSELIAFLGGENLAGGKLKEAGDIHWKNPNTEATNIAHFWALPGGNRNTGNDAVFNGLGEMGCWWTTSSNNTLAINRLMYYNNNQVQKYFYPKNYGLSVRCLRDY